METRLELIVVDPANHVVCSGVDFKNPAFGVAPLILTPKAAALYAGYFSNHKNYD